VRSEGAVQIKAESSAFKNTKQDGEFAPIRLPMGQPKTRRAAPPLRLLPGASIVYRKFLEKVFTVLKGHGFSRAEKIALIKGL